MFEGMKFLKTNKLLMKLKNKTSFCFPEGTDSVPKYALVETLPMDVSMHARVHLHDLRADFSCYIFRPLHFLACDTPVDLTGNETAKDALGYGCTKVSLLKGLH
jgi:hypothetical protein